MGRTACTEPQCLYKGALYLTLPTWLTLSVGHCALSEPAIQSSVRVFKISELKLVIPGTDSDYVRGI